jgi:hypothetical protein
MLARRLLLNDDLNAGRIAGLDDTVILLNSSLYFSLSNWRSRQGAYSIIAGLAFLTTESRFD